MRTIFKFYLLLFVLVSSSVLFSKEVSAQPSYVSYQIFYDQLSPYGQWVEYPNYGYVWIPDYGSDFVPYSTNGHWILSDYGWTWVSDYNWGWAPFHYGRWDFDNFYGWFWVPDNEWGPAWVSWRRADGYYGWAPMEPGISIQVSFGSEYDRNDDHWLFVRERDIDRSDVYRFYVNRKIHERVLRNSRVINNTYEDNRRHTTYVTGPNKEDVRKSTGRNIYPVVIQEDNKPGQAFNNGQLRIYRPELMKSNNNEHKAVPLRVTNLRDVKQPSERRSVNQPAVSHPTNTNKQRRQSGAVRSQNNSSLNPTQTAQPQNAKPVQNKRREVQKSSITPQSNNEAKPVLKQNTAPEKKSQRESKSGIINAGNDKKAKPLESQTVKPDRNSNKAEQIKAVKPARTARIKEARRSKTTRNSEKND